MTTTRQQMLGGLADRVLALRLDHPTRVGIDGPAAAGKATLAHGLAAALPEKTARPVFRVAIDSVKRQVDLRTRYPAGSPEDYYVEMVDLDAVRDGLLGPRGPGGHRHYRTQIMDVSGRTPSTPASSWPRTTRSWWRTAGSYGSGPCPGTGTCGSTSTSR
jgi:uridine kinase